MKPYVYGPVYSADVLDYVDDQRILVVAYSVPQLSPIFTYNIPMFLYLSNLISFCAVYLSIILLTSVVRYCKYVFIIVFGLDLPENKHCRINKTISKNK